MKMQSIESNQAKKVTPSQPIVSSAHLVSPHSAEMSEFEFGLIVAGNAFHRWIVHCMAAAGLKDLTPLDVLVLHHVTHRARDKKLADICGITLKPAAHEAGVLSNGLQTIREFLRKRKAANG